jgi:DNA-cytosine methyltransferase
MIHASLFTGIGGFDLAAEWCGWENSFQCEIDPFCQRVLAKNFPHADRFADIKHFDATPYRGAVDVLSGGFPCQPYSKSGRRKGAGDERALWPHTVRVIAECRPRWFVGENVTGILSMEIDDVLASLEAAGYECWPLVLPAAAVGAPHERERVWLLAHAHGQRREEQPSVPRPPQTAQPAAGRVPRPTPGGEFRLSEPPLYGGNDGIPPDLVRPVKHQRKQLKAYGNSIVPQVALEIFQAIDAIENGLTF